MRYERFGRIALALVGTLASGPLASAQTSADAPLPALTTIKEIRSLSQDEGARGYRVKVKGIVTHIDEKADVSLIVHDGKFGQFVMPPADPRPVSGAMSGAATSSKLKGRTVRGGFAPNVQPDVIRVVSRGALPAPKRIP